MSDDESLVSDAESVDSVDIEEVLEMVLEPEDAPKLCYLCSTSDGEEVVFDRSDLIDGGQMQAKVLRFERLHPPPWDVICQHCGGDGCEECICDECDRVCRHINGVNYGCIKHPVV